MLSLKRTKNEDINTEARRFKMFIALDYDETITLDEVFWGVFIKLVGQMAHELAIVTSRSEAYTEDIEDFAEKHGVKVYYTGGEPKRQYMAKYDIEVDVWIDDSPDCVYLIEGENDE